MGLRLWTAQVFMGSSIGEITVQVQAGTHHGAKQQIYALYGDQVEQIVNLREIGRHPGEPRVGGGSDWPFGEQSGHLPFYPNPRNFGEQWCSHFAVFDHCARDGWKPSRQSCGFGCARKCQGG